MAYIRCGAELPSGNKSSSFVVGDPDGLKNIYKGGLIQYQEIRDWFKTKSDSEIKEELKQRLELQDEESEVVCDGLFYERDNGEWDKPFEYEKKRVV